MVKTLLSQDLGLEEAPAGLAIAASVPTSLSESPVSSFQDPLFRELAARWPQLTPQQRETLMAMLRSWG